MKSMYAEIPIASGEARVMDYDLARLKKRDIPYLRRKIGIVFQDFQLLTDRTVYDNLLFVLRATGWKRKEEMEECIESVLKLVEMDNKGYKMPHQLSGGEQQRIVIARALLNSPRLILADEPTGNLDPETGARIVSLLRHISAMGTTVIMATHNLALTQEYPGRVVRIADRCVAEAEPLALAEASPTALEA
jgi:cell division transport system ATP-binding protein